MKNFRFYFISLFISNNTKRKLCWKESLPFRQDTLGKHNQRKAVVGRKTLSFRH
jgi:hypothetical protein